ncbi:hypothetical protein GXB85_02455 [Cellulomonas sp. APG4]|uniref:hypothetical protein n=1 Tax=Cellulomonas sp. APG4 TaxID=1538656 RepID=UPI00137A8F6E|nr:hypothetical protein [Cellulomonas sp. APG4]NCT89818.1 hypothetical protein [Cellulomonas sp. APG4]
MEARARATVVAGPRPRDGSRGAAGTAARGVAALLAGTVAALAACGPLATPATPPPSGTTAAPPLAPGAAEQIRVEIRQSRSDQAARVVQLRVHAPPSTEVVVASAALEAAGFVGVAALESWDRRVPAGRTRDASVALGEARCAEPSGDGRVRLVLADGARTEVRTEAEDPQGHLARIHAEDCARAALTAALDVEIGSGLATSRGPDGLVATLTLVLVPTRDAPEVVVESVEGTVLLGPAGGGTAWTAPPLGAVVEGPTTVRLPIVPTRCDAHAVAEDKRGTYLGLRATVAGRSLPTVPLDVGDELRGELRAFVADHCGW